MNEHDKKRVRELAREETPPDAPAPPTAVGEDDNGRYFSMLVDEHHKNWWTGVQPAPKLAMHFVLQQVNRKARKEERAASQKRHDDFVRFALKDKADAVHQARVDALREAESFCVSVCARAEPHKPGTYWDGWHSAARHVGETLRDRLEREQAKTAGAECEECGSAYGMPHQQWLPVSGALRMCSKAVGAPPAEAKSGMAHPSCGHCGARLEFGDRGGHCPKCEPAEAKGAPELTPIEAPASVWLRPLYTEEPNAWRSCEFQGQTPGAAQYIRADVVERRVAETEAKAMLKERDWLSPLLDALGAGKREFALEAARRVVAERDAALAREVAEHESADALRSEVDYQMGLRGESDVRAAKALERAEAAEVRVRELELTRSSQAGIIELAEMRATDAESELARVRAELTEAKANSERYVKASNERLTRILQAMTILRGDSE